MSKASKMLQNSISVTERAASFLDSIKRGIQKNVIDTLTEQKEKLTDEIFSLSDFTLATDHNKGQSAITREAAQKRFEQIIEKEYELELITLELETKQKSFTKYFGDEQQ